MISYKNKNKKITQVAKNIAIYTTCQLKFLIKHIVITLIPTIYI